MINIQCSIFYYKERCLSGRKGRFAKPLYELKLVPRVRIPPSPQNSKALLLLCKAFSITQLLYRTKGTYIIKEAYYIR